MHPGDPRLKAMKSHAIEYSNGHCLWTIERRQAADILRLWKRIAYEGLEKGKSGNWRFYYRKVGGVRVQRIGVHARGK